MTKIAIDKHAHEPRHCKGNDLFTFKSEEGATDEDRAKVADFLAEVDAYLAIFAAPTFIDKGDGKKGQVCFHCGGEFSGLLANLGVGVGIEWGLVHGEGRCSGDGCGWPYRGVHHPKSKSGEELFSLTNLFLAYHPDQVSARKQEEAA